MTSNETFKPSVSVKELQFSDGTKVQLGETDIVVFVGPNNAGKSAALREIDDALAQGPRRVLNSIEMSELGSVEQLIDYIKSISRRSQEGSNTLYHGYGYRVYDFALQQSWKGIAQQVKSIFIDHLKTETRITQSNPVNAINFLENEPSNPIHIISNDDVIEKRISSLFNRAFGVDLILYRGGGSVLPLVVGSALKPKRGEDRISRSYIERLREATTPLHEQGDGMRSFATLLLHLFTNENQSMLLVDEPEAFLHPPQARLIGEFIAKERRKRSQIFIATHSTDVLLGLLSAAPEDLRVIRLQRHGNINKAKELPKGRAKLISTDPLMKYSGVISGVFHKRVIITESDADAMFYGAILDLPTLHGDVNPDAMLVQAGGKHRMHTLAAAMRSLDVPVDVIADIDLLNNLDTFRLLLEALDGDWQRVERHARALKNSVEQRTPWIDSAQMKKQISEIVQVAPEKGDFPKELKSRIEAVFRKSSPWETVKSSGRSAISSGQPMSHWKVVSEYCASIGLWIVPVGEVEGFCRDVGGKGPKWTQKVLESYDPATSEELRAAREFIVDILSRK